MTSKEQKLRSSPPTAMLSKGCRLKFCAAHSQTKDKLMDRINTPPHKFQPNKYMDAPKPASYRAYRIAIQGHYNYLLGCWSPHYFKIEQDQTSDQSTPEEIQKRSYYIFSVQSQLSQHHPTSPIVYCHRWFYKRKPCDTRSQGFSIWLRLSDSNQRPIG